MLWGNIEASDSSKPSYVFDTADGFCGVWHFPMNTPLSDATAYSHDGTNMGSISDTGIIGEVRFFDGITNDEDYISIDTSSHLRPTQTITLQAWIYPTGNPDQWDGVFSYIYDDYSWESGYAFAYLNGQWRFFIATDQMSANDWNDNPGSSNIPLNTWSSIVGTYDGSIIKFYLNGNLVASKQKKGLIDWEYLPGDFRIGTYYDPDESYEFMGSLDEIRVLKTACSDAWIKLCYETQKIGSRVIDIR